MENVKFATRRLAYRYVGMISVNKLDEELKKQLQWMCNVIITEDMHIDKMSRWLGYIQGTLITLGFTTVDEERDVSRPMFHEAYEKDGMTIPESRDYEK